jgi:hypothetical protein
MFPLHDVLLALKQILEGFTQSIEILLCEPSGLERGKKKYI